MLQRFWKFGLLLSLSSVPAFAQVTPDTTVSAALRNLSAEAATVFAGEVVAVRHIDGIVEIQFSVSQSLKGQATGSVVLREWAGLWAAGQRRYWVGERAVVFLHENGKYGLSSSVNGIEGILPISSGATASPSVDVQRIRTRVLRDAGSPLVEADSQISLAQLTATVRDEPVSLPVTPPVAVPVAPIGGPVAPPVRKPLPPPIRRPFQPVPVNNEPIRLTPTHKTPIIWEQLNVNN